MLEGIIRESNTKSYTKNLRRDGYLIGNIYAKNISNIYVAFKENEFIKTVKAKKNLYFDVKINSTKYKVVVQDYETHPVTRRLLHVDLMVVQDDIRAKYNIPVLTKGTPIGLKNKGMLYVAKKRIPVKCLGKDIINDITLDVNNLDVGDSILMRDLNLPKELELIDDGRVSVLSCIKAK